MSPGTGRAVCRVRPRRGALSPDRSRCACESPLTTRPCSGAAVASGGLREPLSDTCASASAPRLATIARSIESRCSATLIFSLRIERVAWATISTSSSRSSEPHLLRLASPSAAFGALDDPERLGVGLNARRLPRSSRLRHELPRPACLASASAACSRSRASLSARARFSSACDAVSSSLPIRSARSASMLATNPLRLPQPIATTQTMAMSSSELERFGDHAHRAREQPPRPISESDLLEQQHHLVEHRGHPLVGLAFHEPDDRALDRLRIGRAQQLLARDGDALDRLHLHRGPFSRREPRAAAARPVSSDSDASLRCFGYALLAVGVRSRPGQRFASPQRTRRPP